VIFRITPIQQRGDQDIQMESLFPLSQGSRPSAIWLVEDMTQTTGRTALREYWLPDLEAPPRLAHTLHFDSVQGSLLIEPFEYET